VALRIRMPKTNAEDSQHLPGSPRARPYMLAFILEKQFSGAKQYNEAPEKVQTPKSSIGSAMHLSDLMMREVAVCN
jgi:hypothetical protein